jgi:hypothetical protein
MTPEAAMLIAMLLGRPAGLVSTVYAMGGLDAVAVVYYESRFNERAWRREREGSSFGLFQLYDKYHEQYRDDLLLHIVTGVAFLAECKKMALTCRGFRDTAQNKGISGCNQRHSLAVAYSVWNSGSPRRSIAKGREVEALRDGMAKWLWLRLR